MTPAPDPRRARLQELLGIEATQGLPPAEANELDALLALFPDEDPDGFELAAAAVHLALSKPPEKMPAALAEKLHLAAVAFTPTASPRVPWSRPAWLAWAGWAVAASLAGVLVYTNWPKQERLEIVRVWDFQQPVTVREPTIEEKRNELKARATEFAGNKDRVSGNIVWSDKEQVGYLEVKGLPQLDPSAGTYQLWIVDGERKGSEPIDGGIFQVKADGTALVRIRNPIQVKNAAAFAITRESEPGGVVVTKVPPEKWELVLAKKG